MTHLLRLVAALALAVFVFLPGGCGPTHSDDDGHDHGPAGDSEEGHDHGPDDDHGHDHAEDEGGAG